MPWLHDTAVSSVVSNDTSAPPVLETDETDDQQMLIIWRQQQNALCKKATLNTDPVVHAW